MRIPVILGGLLGWSLFYGLGEYLSKCWSQEPTTAGATWVVLAYSIAAVCWLPALRAHGSLAILTTIFSVVGTLVGVGVGLCIFREPATVRQLVGIGLALISIGLLC